ncbi:phosphoribosylamine--glycine ligase [Desulforudis sp. 1088]|uniref:phosphoribosylamine--glycine ligase n=1 Tax=unclassified Candidatus Desulforudis TaxID=2635950 RepID=UPI003CE50BFD
MKILVIGGGGREHALVWKLSQSPRVTEIFAAPGNPGMLGSAACVPIQAEDIPALLEFAKKEHIDLTVVGPEAPLVKGLADVFAENGLRVFGPERRAAQLEGSKSFAKEVMLAAGVPTAAAQVFDNYAEADSYIRALRGPCVVKADGLAAGKGVIVAQRPVEALQAAEDMLVKGAFGEAGSRILVEEVLEGEEASLLAFTDGKTVLPLLPAQDHKRIYDGDLGPNTGGMGAYAPAPVCPPAMISRVVEEIIVPTVKELKSRGIVYRGVIYAGLMITGDGPKVLEFNVRFGDPEAQPLLALLKNDLADVCEAVIEGRLHEIELAWEEGAAVCVVLAAQGYPGAYPKGDLISGLEEAAKDAMVFHAGTALRNGKIVTAGGRVLGITARGRDLNEAIDRAYRTVNKISFEGMHFRRDIAQKALK